MLNHAENTVDTCAWELSKVDNDNYNIIAKGAVIFSDVDFWKASAIINLRKNFVTQLEGIVRQ